MSVCYQNITALLSFASPYMARPVLIVAGLYYWKLSSEFTFRDSHSAALNIIAITHNPKKCVKSLRAEAALEKHVALPTNNPATKNQVQLLYP